jgi:hypothetical protein
MRFYICLQRAFVHFHGFEDKQRLFPNATVPGSFFNRDGVCLLRGADWIFIYNWLLSVNRVHWAVGTMHSDRPSNVRHLKWSTRRKHSRHHIAFKVQSVRCPTKPELLWFRVHMFNGTKPNRQCFMSDAIPYFVGVAAECHIHFSCVSETCSNCLHRDNMLYAVLGGEFLLYAARRRSNESRICRVELFKQLGQFRVVTTGHVFF